MHVQEALHGAALLGLLDLQLGEQGDKPGKGGWESGDDDSSGCEVSGYNAGDGDGGDCT